MKHAIAHALFGRGYDSHLTLARVSPCYFALFALPFSVEDIKGYSAFQNRLEDFHFEAEVGDHDCFDFLADRSSRNSLNWRLHQMGYRDGIVSLAHWSLIVNDRIQVNFIVSVAWYWGWIFADRFGLLLLLKFLVAFFFLEASHSFEVQLFELLVLAFIVSLLHYKYFKALQLWIDDE